MARRRSGWDEFAKGFGLGQQMVEKWNDTQLKNDLTEAGKMDEIQYAQYSPEQVAQIEADTASGKLTEANSAEYYAGLAPAAKRYSFAGTDRDKAFTDIEKDGLRATQLARVYDKHGKTDLAMQMRGWGRQMEKENRELQTQRRVDDIIAKDFPSNEDELVSMAIDQWGKDMGVGGMGKNAGTTLESVPMLNGSYRVTAFDKDGNATGFKELTRQELLGKARDYLENNRLLELSRADPKNYLPLAINKAQQDRSFAFQLNESLRQQGNADRTFTEGQRQFGIKTEMDAKQHEERMRVERARAGREKLQVVPVYDDNGNQKGFTVVNVTGAKPGQIISAPEGTQFGKPAQVDYTKHLNNLEGQLKEIRTRREYLEKVGKGKFDTNSILPWDSEGERSYDSELKRINDDEKRLLEEYQATRAASVLGKPENKGGKPGKESGSKDGKPGKESGPKDGADKGATTAEMSAAQIAMRMREIESKARESGNPDEYRRANNYDDLKKRYEQLTGEGEISKPHAETPPPAKPKVDVNSLEWQLFGASGVPSMFRRSDGAVDYEALRRLREERKGLRGAWPNVIN